MLHIPTNQEIEAIAKEHPFWLLFIGPFLGFAFVIFLPFIGFYLVGRECLRWIGRRLSIIGQEDLPTIWR